MELLWQMQPADREFMSRWKRPDITLSDRAFIAAVMNIPREQRPWGAITWLSDVYDTSRQTLYTIGGQVRQALLFPNQGIKLPESQPTLLLPPPSLAGPTITVTDNRLKRTILTLLLPGGVTLRPMQDCLQAAFDVNRSVGFLSQFINQEGPRAEDGARFYPRSQKEAAKLLGQDFSVPVQKDVWHVLDKAAQTVIDLERIALRKLEQAQDKGDELADLPWVDKNSSAYILSSAVTSGDHPRQQLPCSRPSTTGTGGAIEQINRHCTTTFKCTCYERSFTSGPGVVHPG